MQQFLSMWFQKISQKLTILESGAIFRTIKLAIGMENNWITWTVSPHFLRSIAEPFRSQSPCPFSHRKPDTLIYAKILTGRPPANGSTLPQTSGTRIFHSRRSRRPFLLAHFFSVWWMQYTQFTFVIHCCSFPRSSAQVLQSFRLPNCSIWHSFRLGQGQKTGYKTFIHRFTLCSCAALRWIVGRYRYSKTKRMKNCVLHHFIRT